MEIKLLTIQWSINFTLITDSIILHITDFN